MVYPTIRDAGVSINLKICCFITSNVKYLGHIIKPGALAIDKARVESLNHLQHHLNAAKLSSFFEM